ncbi:3645_t:CDS:2, partial [Dentiscutata heterogama]
GASDMLSASTSKDEDLLKIVILSIFSIIEFEKILQKILKNWELPTTKTVDLILRIERKRIRPHKAIEEESYSQSLQNLKRKQEEDDSIDFELREMKIFQTTRKVYKKLKGHSDIDKNDSETQFLWSEYYHVFGKLNPLSEFDHTCVGRILKPKKKIKLKHMKKVVEDDLNEGVIGKNDIRFIARNARITRSAFKYSRRKQIFVLEVLKTIDDVV